MVIEGFSVCANYDDDSISKYIVKNKTVIIQLSRCINQSIIPQRGGTLDLLWWTPTFASLFPETDLLYLSFCQLAEIEETD
jgi:hypothetical protein